MNIEQPLDPKDSPVAQSMREARAAGKGTPLGVDSRPGFDARREAVAAAEGVTVAEARVGNIPGFWCRPANATPGARVLFLHGGGYMLGSARAFTHFAGQLATRAGADTFVADYRLAPEHRFPAAVEDAVAVYHGLVEGGARSIAISGESAGGGLSLVLLAVLAAEAARGTLQPAAAAVMSPFVDLTLSGDSYTTRAEADPVFTRGVLQGVVETYLDGQDPRNPLASPLFGPFQGLPPIRIDVGDDEIVLDDATRYAQKARAAGTEVALHVWKGMPHVFQTHLGRLVAAGQSMDGIGAFLRARLGRP